MKRQTAILVATLLAVGTLACGGEEQAGGEQPAPAAQEQQQSDVSDEELARRRAAQAAQGWRPAEPRKRRVTAALKAYAKLATSADKGAVRNLELLD